MQTNFTNNSEKIQIRYSHLWETAVYVGWNFLTASSTFNPKHDWRSYCPYCKLLQSTYMAMNHAKYQCRHNNIDKQLIRSASIKGKLLSNLHIQVYKQIACISAALAETHQHLTAWRWQYIYDSSHSKQ